MGTSVDDVSGEEPVEPSGTPAKDLVGRRRFLRYAAVTGAVATAGSQLNFDPAWAAQDSADAAAVLDASGLSRTVVRLARRADQLDLRLTLWNLRIDSSTATARLVRNDAGSNAFIAIDFGSQSVGEETFFETEGAGNETLPATPVQARAGKASLLVFDVTAALPLPYTIASILNWAPFAPRLVPNARVTATRGLRAPIGPDGNEVPETALEVPWRVVVSPDESGAWAHAIDPVQHGAWVELWHTRLASREGSGSAAHAVEGEDAPPVRAVWSTDPNFAAWLTNPASIPTSGLSDATFQASLTPRNRYDIVRLSSDFNLHAAQSQLPAPINVDSLALSSLGASVDLSGAWDMTAPVNGYFTGHMEWQHASMFGRDQKVRVVSSGYLFPFGHRASLVTVVERKFQRAGATSSGARGGYLRRRTFLVVRDVVRDFEHDPAILNGGRKLPFRSIVAATRVTPDLAQVTSATGFVPGSTLSFVPTVDGSPVQFQFRGTDWTGKDVAFSSPVVFISGEGAATTHLGQVMAKYNTLSVANPIRIGHSQGHTISMAASAKSGDTSLAVDEMVFSGAPLANGATQTARIAADLAPFLPALERATGRVPNLAGVTGTEPEASVFTYFGQYLTSGFDAAVNPGAVFLGSVADAAKSTLGFATEMAGGVVNPTLAINGLSRVLGPVGGDLVKAAVNKFDPADVFALADAKILGGLSLKDILQQVTTARADASQAVRTVSEEIHDAAGLLERIETRLRWQPALAAGPGASGMFVPGSASGLDIDARVISRLLPSPDATYVIRGELKDFTVNLWGNGASRFVSVRFAMLKFSQSKGTKPDFDCDVADVGFHGPLSFLSDLADLFSFTGVPHSGSSSAASGSAMALPGTSDSAADGSDSDGDDRWIQVTPAGIAIQRSFAIPTISLGFLSLTELAIEAGLTLPFDGDPARLRFALNSRERPFSLTVSMFGGGGFAGIELGLGGIEKLEFSLEFGAGTSFQIGGLVSGAVELKGGIYYGVETTPEGVQQAELTAYVRMSGALTVLGLVTVSALLYIGLSYQDPDRLVGEAQLSVRVEVLFWEKTFQFHVRREFTKGGGSPAVSSSSSSRAGSSSATARSGSTAAIDAAAAPSFVDLITQQEWQQYCSAFAPVGA